MLVLAYHVSMMQLFLLFHQHRKKTAQRNDIQLSVLRRVCFIWMGVVEAKVTADYCDVGQL